VPVILMLWVALAGGATAPRLPPGQGSAGQITT
jgi:hypothetical protein